MIINFKAIHAAVSFFTDMSNQLLADMELEKCCYIFLKGSSLNSSLSFVRTKNKMSGSRSSICLVSLKKKKFYA